MNTGKAREVQLPIDPAWPPDPIELPNGALQGSDNNLPGIGYDIPIPHGQALEFPDGFPLLDANQATLVRPLLAPPSP